jgi:hypothetical protein
MTRAGWGYDDQPVTSLAIDPDPDPPPCGEGIILRRTSPARDVLCGATPRATGSTLGLQTQSKFVGEDPGDHVLSYSSHGWARCCPWLRLRGAWRAEQARAAALRTGLQEVLQRVGQSFGPKPEGKTLGGETVQGPGAEMRRGKESARLEPNGQRGRMSRRGPGEIGAPAGTRVPNTEGGRDWWS